MVSFLIEDRTQVKVISIARHKTHSAVNRSVKVK